MIGNLSFFVLTIVDGMFVGNGVGSDALGAVSLAMPFVNFIWALSTLFNARTVPEHICKKRRKSETRTYYVPCLHGGKYFR